MIDAQQQINAAQNGDHDAFVSLIKDRTDKLHRVARHYVRESKDAEDIVQDALVKAYESLQTLQQAEAFESWLTRIVVNRALNHLKKSKRVHLSEDPQAQEPLVVNDIDQTLDLERALASLNPKLRQLLFLKYKKDLTQQQIAHLLDMPLGTVKTQLRKGLEHLRNEMAQDFLERDLDTLRLQLRQQAEHQFAVSPDYDLIVNDYQENTGRGTGKGEAGFLWVKTGSDDAVSATLSRDGNLLDYAISWASLDNETRISEEELKQQAEQFLEDHYPGALRDFPYCEMEWMEGMFVYTRQQKAMGLPLPETGCLIMVHPSGRVVGFRYYGTVPGPALPTMITPEEEQMACMKANFLLHVEYCVLDKAVYTDGDDQVHLVYAPRSRGLIYTASSQEEVPTAYRAEAVPSDPRTLDEWPGEFPPARSLEEWIGVDNDQFQLVQDDNIGSNTKLMVWKQQNEERPAKNDRSWKAYWADQMEGAVKARVDSQTGQLIDFVSHGKPDQLAPLTWDRDACIEVAMDYVRGLAAEMLPYLKLLTEETDDEDRLEIIRFGVYVQDVSVRDECYQLAVDRSNGRVKSLMSPSIRPEQLKKLETVPSFDYQTAILRWTAQAKLRLQWERMHNTRAEEAPYELVYRMIGSEHERTPEVLDAHTGKLYENTFY